MLRRLIDWLTGRSFSASERRSFARWDERAQECEQRRAAAAEREAERTAVATIADDADGERTDPPQARTIPPAEADIPAYEEASDDRPSSGEPMSATEASAVTAVTRAATILTDVIRDIGESGSGKSHASMLDDAERILDSTLDMVNSSAWSPAAERLARADLRLEGIETENRRLRSQLEDLFNQVTQIKANAASSAPTPGLLGTVMRMAAGALLGAVIAGPAAALLPDPLTVWVGEPAKAAIGGAVGALAADATKPADRWIASRKAEGQRPAPTRTPVTSPRERRVGKPVDQPGSTPIAQPEIDDASQADDTERPAKRKPVLGTGPSRRGASRSTRDGGSTRGKRGVGRSSRGRGGRSI